MNELTLYNYNAAALMVDPIPAPEITPSAPLTAHPQPSAGVWTSA